MADGEEGKQNNPDIMLLLARSLTHLVDVLPSSCVAVVHYEAVSCFVARLLTIQYMDLAEQSLQSLKNISQEHPTACLRAGALMAVLSYLDFFSTRVQRLALATAANMCKKLPSDASDFIMEVVPLLTNLLQYNDAKVLEHASICLTRIIEAFASYPDSRITAQNIPVNSMALVIAITDIMRHLRKSIHHTLDDAKMGAELIKWNRLFQESVDKCLVELSNKVGDAGPILDVMAVMLENITSIQVVARITIAAVYRASQIIASMPNLSYQNKAFPEALFHQLLPAMVHPDHETRVGAHRIFSVVLVPSSVSPQKVSEETCLRKATDFSRALSRTVSVFSSSAALFGKLRDQRSSSQRSSSLEKGNLEMEQKGNNGGMLNRQTNQVAKCGPISLRLSSHQIVLLLSSLWVQSISPKNMPENYEAIAHTFSMVLLFSRAKNSYREALVQSFQLAFSLRNVALVEGDSLLILMDSEDRNWMNCLIWSHEFERGVKYFLEKAFERASQENEILCPCEIGRINIGIMEMWWRITCFLECFLLVAPNGFSVEKVLARERHTIQSMMMKILICVMILMDLITFCFLISITSLLHILNYEIINE
ncbi:hypothetical protein P3S67_007422 [Capsicum chacoense]